MQARSEYLRAHVHAEPASAVACVDIMVAASVVDAIYRHTLHMQKNTCAPVGFYQKHAPIKYLDTYYGEHIGNHLKEFILKYCVVSYLYQTLRQQHVACVGEPRLAGIELHPGGDARYTFQYTAAQTPVIRDWRYLPYKAPLRKKYKDIDKQAALFVESEEARKKQYGSDRAITTGDWVLFSITLLNSQEKAVVPGLAELLWVQLSDEESSVPFRELLGGRKNGDRFVSSDQCLHEYFSSQLDTRYTFGIIILEVLPHAYFCLDTFRDKFKLKTDRKTHQKIVEIYSSRNDLSLRRAMVEEALSLLGRVYPVTAPEPAVLRQEKLLRDDLQLNPDYTVYKLQPGFNQKVRLLAQKQVREHILLAYLAQYEKIDVDDSDVFHYLNLTKRPRTKEFIYHLHPAIRANEDETPIPHEELKHACVHEKVLNHVLFHLTK